MPLGTSIDVVAALELLRDCDQTRLPALNLHPDPNQPGKKRP